MRFSLPAAAAFLALSAALGAQTVGFTPGDLSPTSYATAQLFAEAADQYLDVWQFTDITDPVLFFQMNPSSIANGSNATSDPIELGLGAWFDSSLYGAVHLGFSGRTAGNLNGGVDSETQSSTPTVIVNGEGQMVGQRLQTLREVNYTVTNTQVPTLLAGLKLGSMNVGIRSRTTISSSDTFGTFDGAFSAGSASEDVTTIGGVVTSRDSRLVPETGYNKSGTLGEELLAGLRLPMPGMDVLAGLGVTANMRTDERFGSYIDVQTQSQGGYASFKDFSGVTAYTAFEDKATDNALELQIPVLVGLEMPYSVFQNPAVLQAGLGYTFGLTLPSTGETRRRTTVSRTTTVDGNAFITTTDIEAENLSLRDEAGLTSQTFVLPLGLTLTPNDQVRFAFQYAPSLVLSTNRWTSATKQTTKTVINDGDGLDPSIDSGDSTTVTTVTSATDITQQDSFRFSHSLRSALQLVLMPEFLRLNLGTVVSNTPVNRLTTTLTRQGLGKTVTESTVTGVTNTTTSTPTDPGADSRTVSETPANVTVATELGLTLWVNPNVTFDFVMSNNAGLNLTSTAASGGFFDLRNFSILMTIKLPPSSASRAGETARTPSRAVELVTE